MSFLLNSSLSSSAVTLSLRNSGAALIGLQTTIPTYLIITRASDGAKEVVRAVFTVSVTDLTILRAQLGSTALSFVSGDSVDILPALTNIESIYIHIGSPALGTSVDLNAAIALTGSPQTGVVPTGQPDVPRQVSIKGNAGGNAGNVVFHGKDSLGNSLSETLALNGTSIVYSTNAFAQVDTVDLPAETHAGTDTVELGTGPALGLPVAIPRNTVEMAYLNNVREGTAPTVTFGAVAASKVTLSSALNGTPVALYLKNG